MDPISVLGPLSFQEEKWNSCVSVGLVHSHSTGNSSFMLDSFFVLFQAPEKKASPTDKEELGKSITLGAVTFSVFCVDSTGFAYRPCKGQSVLCRSDTSLALFMYSTGSIFLWLCFWSVFFLFCFVFP